MRAVITLADFVRVADGKLDLIGSGWDIYNGGHAGVGVRVWVPWDQANRKHHFCLELVDTDGNAVLVPSQEGGFVPLKVEGQFEVGRPPGMPEGIPLSAPLPPLNHTPLPLTAGKRYVWHLTIDHQPNEDWDAAFTVAPTMPQMKVVS